MAEQFDVFLSHHSSDAQWAAKLKSALEVRGVQVWLDQEQIRPGDLFIDALEKGLQASRCVALIVSPGALRSAWVKEEYYRALTLANSAKTLVRLIPVLLAEAELPGFLASRSWVDFRDPVGFDGNVEKLTWGILGKPAPQPLPSANASEPEVAPAALNRPQAKLDEVAYLERALAREKQTIGKLWAARMAAPLAGLAIFAAAVLLDTDMSWSAKVIIGMGSPLTTGLIGWGVTAGNMQSSQAKKTRLACLKDGLELCQGTPNPGCSRLRGIFWGIVEVSAGISVGDGQEA